MCRAKSILFVLLLSGIAFAQPSVQLTPAVRKQISRQLVQVGSEWTYTVNRRAITVFRVSRDLYGNTRMAEKIIRWNSLKEPYLIYQGQNLKILEAPTKTERQADELLSKLYHPNSPQLAAALRLNSDLAPLPTSAGTTAPANTPADTTAPDTPQVSPPPRRLSLEDSLAYSPPKAETSPPPRQLSLEDSLAYTPLEVAIERVPKLEVPQEPAVTYKPTEVRPLNAKRRVDTAPLPSPKSIPTNFLPVAPAEPPIKIKIAKAPQPVKIERLNVPVEPSLAEPEIPVEAKRPEILVEVRRQPTSAGDRPEIRADTPTFNRIFRADRVRWFVEPSVSTATMAIPTDDRGNLFVSDSATLAGINAAVYGETLMVNGEVKRTVSSNGNNAVSPGYMSLLLGAAPTKYDRSEFSTRWMFVGGRRSFTNSKKPAGTRDIQSFSTDRLGVHLEFPFNPYLELQSRLLIGWAPGMKELDGKWTLYFRHLPSISYGVGYSVSDLEQTSTGIREEFSELTFILRWEN